MQTDDLPAPLVQLSQALVSGIVIAHTKTMICFANQFKISSCRINKRRNAIDQFEFAADAGGQNST
jgi:hypothetical protein